MAGGEVRLVDLVKQFDEVTAVDGLNLHVPGGEFFSLLGPSGCGKTTTLRLIAGFEQPTSGTILLDGTDMAHIPPHKRKVNTVFQSYALFPFLSVEDNVAFGLKYKGVSKREARVRAREALARVRMEGMENRRPAHLSGGQQQRVALARALVLNPSVLLLDEPLGSLDAKLRKALQIELKTLQEDLAITFIYVTHDQEEALTMSDRIAVMANGNIEQVGSSTDVYEEPANAWVADFLGVSNLMEAWVKGRVADGGCRLRVGEFDLTARQGDTDAAGAVKLVIRPERVALEPYETTGENRVPGMVDRMVYMGPTMHLIVHLASGMSLQVMVPNRGEENPFPPGTPVSVLLPADSLRVLRHATQSTEVATGGEPEFDGESPGPLVETGSEGVLGAPPRRGPLRTERPPRP